MCRFARTYGCSSGMQYHMARLAEYEKSQQLYTDTQIQEKVAEASSVLVKLGIEKEAIQKPMPLILLALSGIKPDTGWDKTERTVLTMTKGIIRFAIDNYNIKDITNNRDQFRREGINVLMNYDLIDLNPDNKNLGPNSPLTHYALKNRVIERIKRITK